MRGTIPKPAEWLVVAAMALLLCGCAAGKRISTAPVSRVPLPPLDLSITLPPGADIDPAQVSAERLTLEEALAGGRAPSDLPPEFRPVEAFVIRPEDVVLEDPARLRIVLEEDLPAGTRLFLFRVGASRRVAGIDDGYVAADGSVAFETRVFGYFIVAENTLIARPSDAFLVFGFADVSEGAVPLTVNLRAFAFGGAEPYAFTWDFGDGSESAQGSETAHTYYAVGEYEVSVYAEDAAGVAARSSSTTIVVTSEYSPLAGVNVSVFPTTSSRSNQRQFVGVLQGGVPPFTWSWSFSDGYTSTESAPVHEFAATGLYSGSVTVTDAVFDTASDDFVVDLRRIELTGSPTFGYAPLEVTFNLAASGLGEEVAVRLDYGDGTSVNVDPYEVPALVHVYDEAGTYHAVVEASEMYEGGLWTVSSQPVDVVVLESPVPTIYSIFPPQAETGQGVVVYGVDFGYEAGPGDKVTFYPGVDAQIVQWGDTAIELVVPAGAEDGDIFVTRTEHTSAFESNRMYFNVLEPGQEVQPPVIMLVSPSQGPVGTIVNILGMHFGATQLPGDRVSLGYYHLIIHSWSDEVIVAEIPVSAESGHIVVLHDGMQSNGYYFEVGIILPENPPRIDSLVPSSGPRGSLVSVLGANFGAYEEGSMVLLGTLPMTVTLWTPDAITVRVPTQGSNGDIRVFHQGVLSNAVPFIVKPAPPDLYSLEQL